jgi:putative copper resistance protein D
VDDPLIFVRAVHFAATLTVAGAALFDIFIAQPVIRSPACTAKLRATVVRRLAWIAWIGLLLTLLSGAAWFVLVAQSISDQPLASVVSDGSILRAVLLDTEFGRNWLLRLLLIALLAGLLAADLREKQKSRSFLKLAIVLVAAGLAGTLAWAGHGIGGAGPAGGIHLAADFLHLIAAAAWVGGLLPLAIMLAAAAGGSVRVAHVASLHFSAYGIVAVGTLILTGAINTWYLAGSIRALTETDYGHLLLVKIALFLVMLTVATINRLWLTPALAVGAGEPTSHALRQLRRNVVVEIAVGALILAVVAVLGVTPPGAGEQRRRAL